MRGQTRLRSRKGYSLMEMIVVVAVVGTIMGVGARLIAQLIEFYAVSNARIAIQRDLRSTLDSVNRNLRQAKSDSINVAALSLNPPYSYLWFVDVAGSTHTFHQDGRSFYHTKNGNIRTLTKDLSYVAFSYPRTDNNHIMSISITLQRSTYKGRTTALQMAVSKVRIMN